MGASRYVLGEAAHLTVDELWKSLGRNWPAKNRKAEHRHSMGGASFELLESRVFLSGNLTGTIIGTSGSYNNDGNTIANVFDGNTSTFFDAPTAGTNSSPNWVGLDLGAGNTAIVTAVSYAPRVSFESRMVGGVFQESNDPTFTTGVVTLATITATPADGYTTIPVSGLEGYRYERYLAPVGAYGDIAEMQLSGVTVTTPPTATVSSSGKTAALSIAASETGNPALTYTWSAATLPTGVTAMPTFSSANGTTTGNAVTATFAATGTYGLDVTITDPSGHSAVVPLSVTVAQVLTSIAVSPASPVSVPVSTNQTFTATALDQFGLALVTQPSFTWSLATGSSGTIVASTGVYTASATVGSAATVKATSGTVVGTASVTASQAPSNLTGTIIGTSGSYNNDGNTIANVFDGNTSTFFDAPTAGTASSPNWVGLDFGAGTTNTVTAISYAPRVGFESRMVGGVFQESNDPTFNTGVTTLATITTTPPDGFTNIVVSGLSGYRYIRYVAPVGAYGDIAELKFFGTVSGTGPTVTTQPTTQTVTAGGSVSFTAAASGNPTPTVQWQVSTNNGTTFTPLSNGTGISGATTTSLTLSPTTAAENGYEYEAVFTNAAGSATTSAATLTVQQAPAITTQPTTQTVTAGGSVSFTAAASGNPTPTVQWEVSTNNGSTFTPISNGTGVSGVTTPSLTLSPTTTAESGYEYEAVFTNAAGSATSSAATLTVQQAPAITTQPTNQTVTAGNSATFTAAASGTPAPTVQWQVSTNNGSTFAPLSNGTGIAGATTTSLTLSPTTAAQNGYEYEAVFTNAAGSATSSAATLTVQQAPSITTQPTNQTVATGGSATFTAAASGNPTPTVQWEVSTNNGTTFTPLTNGTGITGATTPSLTLSPTTAAENGYEYEAVFTNAAGSATTSAATLTVQQTIPAAPSGLTATAVSGSQINLAWTSNSTKQTGFIIQRSPDDSTWTTLTTTAASATTYSDTTVAAITTYYYRVAATNSAGTSAYSTAASATTPVATLTGTIIGTPGSYSNDGNTIANVFDNNLTTFFDAPTAGTISSPNWVGRDLGSAYTITAITFAPRVGFESRMVGGYFQASNDPNFVNGDVTLATITTTPADGYTTVNSSATGAYRYVRYVAPPGASGNIAELQFAGTNASTSTPPSAPGVPTLTYATSTSTQITWAASTDSIGVAYYKIYRNGTQVGTSATNTYTDTGLTPATAYAYTIYAVDFDANVSTTSPTASIATTTPLTSSTIIGTPGSYNNGGTTIANVFDGNLTTFFDGPTAGTTGSPNWVGLDFGAGTTNTVTAISYAPRQTGGGSSQYEARMVGGVFQESNDPTFTTGVVTLATITTTPPDGFTTIPVSGLSGYRYIRYLAATGTYGDIAELQFFGTAASTTLPTVTTNPANQTVTAGGSATFTAAASGNPTPTVQWQVSTNNGTTFTPLSNGTGISGATTTSLTLSPTTAAQNGYEYEAVFTNAAGSATTSAATLTVQQTPAITTQPTNQTVNAGGSVSFTAAASGNPAPTVQWQVSTNNGSTFAPLSNGTGISGATTTSLTLSPTAAAQNGYEYEAVFTNAAGSATTSAATLTVRQAPAITTQPTNQTATAGASATFTAAASGNPTPTVQWDVSTNNGTTFTPLSNGTGISGATTTSLTLSPTTTAESGYEYEAVFTNAAGGATSSAATLTVQQAPAITTQPSNQTVTTGGSPTFTAAASGNPASTVQWEVSTNNGSTFTPLSNGTGISGATTPSLTLSSTTATQNGYEYEAVFTNAAGSATTSAATLTVQRAIPAPPSGLTANAASSTQINLAWASNSTNQTGFIIQRSPDDSTWTTLTAVTTTSYSDSGLSPGTAYYYRVCATNSGGNSAYTNPASATTPATIPLPNVYIEGSASAVSNQPYVLNLFSDNASFTWQINWGDGTAGSPDIISVSSSATTATHTFTSAPASVTITAQAIKSGQIISTSSLALNPQYGTNGWQTAAAGAGAQAVAIQADGAVVVLGSDGLERFNTDGSQDTTFGGNGGDVALPSGTNWTSLAIGENGDIVVGGANGADLAMALYGSNGNLLSQGSSGSFGDGSGSVSVGAVAFEDNEAVVVGGYVQSDSQQKSAVMAAFSGGGGSIWQNQVGSGASTSNGYGYSTVAIDPGDEYVDATRDSGEIVDQATNAGSLTEGFISLSSADPVVAISSSGNVLLGGQDLEQYDADGSSDSYFGASGAASLSPSGSASHQVLQILPQANGQILLLESNNTGGTILARYDANGKPVSNFGVAGLVSTSFADSATAIASLASGGYELAGIGAGGAIDIAQFYATNAVQVVGPPNVSLNAISSGTENSPLTINATAASGGGFNDVLTYQWAVTEGANSVSLPNGGVTGGPHLTFTPASAGNYSVSLTVTDTTLGSSAPAASATFTVTVPPLNIVGPNFGYEEEALHYQTTAPWATGATWTATLSDGNRYSGTGLDFSFTPVDKATGTVTVTGTAPGGATQTVSTPLTVSYVQPTLSILGSPIGFAGRAMVFSSSVIQASGLNDPLSYQWQLLDSNGNAVSVSGPSTSSTFTIPGLPAPTAPATSSQYQVKLTVIDTHDGTTTSISQTSAFTIMQDPSSPGFSWGAVTMPSNNGALDVVATTEAQQPDGKILVAGDFGDDFSEDFNGELHNAGLFVARFNSDLTLDTTFGPNHTGYELVPQAPFGVGLSSATLDSSFGANNLGYPPVDFYDGPPTYEVYPNGPGATVTGSTSLYSFGLVGQPIPYAMTINPINDDIVLVGGQMYGYSWQGDAGGTNDVKQIPWVAEILSSPVLDSDGKIHLAGAIDPNFNGGNLLVLLNNPLANSFYSGAAEINSYADWQGTADAVTALPDGSLLVGGKQQFVGNSGSNVQDFMLFKVTAPSASGGGQLDLSFGDHHDGFADDSWVDGTTPINTLDYYEQFANATSIVVEPDGSSDRILLGGYASEDPVNFDPLNEGYPGFGETGFAIAGFNLDGTVDTTFGTGSSGNVFTPSSAFDPSGDGSLAYMGSMEIQDGSIVAVGIAETSAVAYNGGFATNGAYNVAIAQYSLDGSSLNDILTPLTREGPGSEGNGTVLLMSFDNIGQYAFGANGTIYASLNDGYDYATAIDGWQLGQIDTVEDDSGIIQVASTNTAAFTSPASSLQMDVGGNILYTDSGVVATGFAGEPGIFGGVPATNNGPIVQNAIPVVRYNLSAPALNLDAQASINGSINLTWTDSSTADGYEILREEPPSSTYALLTTVGADQNSYSDTSELTPGRTYRYQVVPINGDTAGDLTLGTPSAIASAPAISSSSGSWVQSIAVPLNGTTASSNVLSSGDSYLVMVSGTAPLATNDEGVTSPAYFEADPAYWFESDTPSINGSTLDDDSGTGLGAAFGIGIGGDAASPSVNRVPDWGSLNLANHTYAFVVSGDGGPLTFQFHNADQANLISTYGSQTLSAQIYQLGGTGGSSSTVPVRAIVSPASSGNGQAPTITAATPVSIVSATPGGAATPWSLWLVPAAGGSGIELSSGSSSAGQLPVSGAVMATIDPTREPNGLYTLELQDGSGNVADAEQVDIQSISKLGDLVQSDTDLSISTPVGGTLPVSRIYDSAQADVDGPLGYGWTLNLLDAQLKTTESPESYDASHFATQSLQLGDSMSFYVPYQWDSSIDYAFEEFFFDPVLIPGSENSQTGPEYEAHFTTLNVDVDAVETLSVVQASTGDPITLTFNTQDGQFYYQGNGGQHVFDPTNPALGLDFKLTGSSPVGTWLIDPSTGKLLSYVDGSGSPVASTAANPYSADSQLFISHDQDVVNEPQFQDTSTMRPGDLVSLNVPGDGQHVFEFDPTVAQGDESWTTDGSSTSVVYTPTFVATDGSGDTLTLQADPGSLVGHGFFYSLDGFRRPSSLSLTYDQSDDQFIFLNSYVGNVVGFDPSNPVLDLQYVLTTKNGDSYTINAATGGIESCAAPGGTVIYSVDASGDIVDGNGKALLNIQWSGAPLGSQILSINAPGQNPVSYSYSENGNLASVTDQAGNQTTYSYLDSSNSHLLTAITNWLGVNVLSAQYQPAEGLQTDGELTSVTDQNGTNIPIDYSLPENAAGVQVQADGSGNIVEDVYDNYGNVIRSILPLSDASGDLTGYQVTAANFTYGLDQDSYPSPGTGTVDALQTVQSYAPFQINGVDPDDLRYTQDPLPTTLEQETDYVTSGQFLGQVQMTKVPVDFSGTLLVTINGNFSIVNASSGAIKPLNVIAEIWTPDAEAPLGGGYDVNVQSITSMEYNAQGELVDSVKSLLVPDSGNAGNLLATGTAYDYGNNLPVDSYSITADINAVITPNEGVSGTEAISNIQQFGPDQMQNVYYTTTDGAGAVQGEVEYSINAAGEKTFYAYSPSGQTLLQYVFKTITSSSGPLNVWVGTSSVYNDLGQLTDTYAATYLDDPNGGTPMLYTLASGADGVIVNTRKNAVYAAPLRTVHNDYNNQGQLADSIDQYGGMTSYVYDANGQTIETINPNGTEVLTVYDDKQRAIWTTNAFDPNGNPDMIVGTNTVYNDLGQATQTNQHTGTVIDISGSSSSLGSAGTYVSSTDQYYDAKGQVVETASASGLHTATIYYPDGQAAYTGPMQPSLANDPANGSGIYTGTPWYNSTPYTSGAISTDNLNALFATSATPGNDHAQYTTSEYDLVHSTTISANFTIPAVGTTVSVSVGSVAGLAVGDSVVITGAGDFQIASITGGSLILDNLGAAPDGSENTSVGTTIDSGGALTGGTLLYNATIDANGSETDTYTDALGRAIRTVYPDGSYSEALYSTGTTAVTTDEEGDSISSPQSIASGGSETVTIAERIPGAATTADPMNITFDYSNDAGDLTDVYQPAVANALNGGAMTLPHTSYTYDSAGNELSETDAKGNLTTFGYDQNGNQVIQTLSAITVNNATVLPTETWTYNANNQIATHTDFDGNVATYSYITSGPQAGLLQGVVYAGAPGSGKAAQIVNYTYNDLNQQESVTDASGTTIDSYDAFGNLVESNTPEGVIRYAFDPVTGNHTDTWTGDDPHAVNGNTWTHYGYDNQGRLITVTVNNLNGAPLATPLVTTYTYDNVGNKLSETLPDGEVTSYTYDALNRLTGQTEVQPSATTGGEPTTDFSQTFTLNPDGTRATSTETQLQPNGSTIATNSTWTYDAEDRLTGEAVSSSDSADSFIDVYSYDLNGNRIEDNHTGPGGGASGTTSYTYNGEDELTGQTSGVSGTTTNSYDLNGSLTSSSVTGGATTTYTYDVRNKLVGYSNGTSSATYVYDDDGDRVQETTGGATTYYLTDTQNPTGYAQPLEAKPSTTVLPTTTYVLGDRVLAQADSGGHVSYLLTDGHGSTQQMTNASGTVTAAFQYDAFGGAINFNPAVASTVFLFGGDAVYDPVSGLYLHGNGERATSGFLFIQRDAFAGSTSDPQSLHKYVYSSADPVNGSDPTARFTLVDSLASAGDAAAEASQEEALGAGADGLLDTLGADLEQDQVADSILESADSAGSDSSEANELTNESLDEEEQTANEAEDGEDDEDEQSSDYYYHYTDSLAAALIFATQTIKASKAYASFGLPSGAYATDISPYSIGLYTQDSLARLLYFSTARSNTADVSWCDIIEDDQGEFQFAAPFEYVAPAPAGTFVPLHVVAVVPNLMRPY